jgi:non-heme chloroperoxidase
VQRLSATVFTYLVASTALPAQDFNGAWQGLTDPSKFRVVLTISKATSGSWSAAEYYADWGPDPIPATSVMVHGSTVTLVFGILRNTYVGSLSADTESITGSWIEGHPWSQTFLRATPTTAWPLEVGSHTARFIRVAPDVTLEVLDWGGSGRPVVLLAGLTNSAHRFDRFAPKLTPSYHVYGITRRGFGASSAPATVDTNYLADRLGDDVLAVVDSLKLERPVLVGHSIAGEELSSICARHPERVGGVVYLDAAAPHAYYDTSRGDLQVDLSGLRRTLERLSGQRSAPVEKRLIQELLYNMLPQLTKDLEERSGELRDAPDTASSPYSNDYVWPPIDNAVLLGEEPYTEIKCPALAIAAIPKDSLAAIFDERQISAFRQHVPGARVVLLRNAMHYVYESNEADVVREMSAFIGGLRP